MVDAIPYLVPNQFQESIFPSITRQKIPAQDIQYKQYTHWNIRPDDSEWQTTQAERTRSSYCLQFNKIQDVWCLLYSF